MPEPVKSHSTKNEKYHLPEPLTNLPFKIATTSFIYPDQIVPNVIKLGAMFDEIELLLFESKPFIPDNQAIKSKTGISRGMGSQCIKSKPIEVLPSSEDIRQLASLSKSLSVTYNIHLPVDISLTDRSKTVRRSAIETIKRVVELCAPLNPTTHTLHVELDIKNLNSKAPSNTSVKPCNSNKLNQWRSRAAESLEILSSSLYDPSIISIETLDYPFEYIGDIVESCGMSICIDAGHLIRNGYKNTFYSGSDGESSDLYIVDEYNIEKLFGKYKTRIPLIHLHGVDFSSDISSPVSPVAPKDHQSLDKTPIKMLAPTMNLLREFNGVVSLELFNYQHLFASLTFLNNFFMNKNLIKSSKV